MARMGTLVLGKKKSLLSCERLASTDNKFVKVMDRKSNNVYRTIPWINMWASRTRSERSVSFPDARSILRKSALVSAGSRPWSQHLWSRHSGHSTVILGFEVCVYEGLVGSEISRIMFCWQGLKLNPKPMFNSSQSQFCRLIMCLPFYGS